MKRSALFVFCFLANGCGDLSASIAPLTDSITLVASKAYSPDVHTDASYRASRPGTVVIPSEVNVTQGNAGTFSMTLYIGSVTCLFEGADFGTKYKFISCNSGHIAGQSVSVHQGDYLRVHVNAGDAAQGLTQIQVQFYL